MTEKIVLRAAANTNDRHRPSANSRKQAGVGLIEVLVSILITSFALLGLAGLQITSLRYQKVAQFRTAASQYAADMADRVRANVAAAKAGNYVTSVSDKLGDNATVAACATGCTTAQIAAQDIYNWRLGLKQAMAGGWGEITGDATAGFFITVYFKEPDKSRTSTALDTSCRASALNASSDKDVRCFQTVFLP